MSCGMPTLLLCHIWGDFDWFRLHLLGNKNIWRRKSWFNPGDVWRVRVVGCWLQSNRVTQLSTDRYLWLMARLDGIDLGAEVPNHPPSTLSLTQMQNADLAPVPLVEREQSA